MPWDLAQLSEVRLSRRFDAEYFRPENVEAEARVRQHSIVRLGNLGRFIPGPFGSAFQTRNYESESLFRYIRGRDVKPFFLRDDDSRYLPEADYQRLIRYAVMKDDLLISVVGTLGPVSLCAEQDSGAIFSCKSTVFRAKTIDPRYLCTFLSSSFGQRCLLRRQRGAIQTGLNIEDLAAIPVPRLGAIEAETSGRVAQAQSDILASRRSFRAAAESLERALGQVPASVGHEQANAVPAAELVTAGRFDAQCFNPRARRYDKWLRDQGAVSIESLTSRTKKGRQQTELQSGLPYCTIKHIDGHEVASTGFCATDCADAPIARRLDLLVAITGATIGKVGIVSRFTEVRFSGDLMSLSLNSDVDPHYVLAAIESEVGQLQIARWITGSTNGHLAPSDMLRVLIPRLEPQKEAEIAAKMREGLRLAMSAEVATQRAVKLVEDAIG